MKNQELLKKAAQQALAEVLGYDEARAYYLILTRQEKELESEFSYSKKYRLLKNLFELGAVGKIKPGQQDFFNYFLLPPSFLYFERVDLEIIEVLEKSYLDNFREIFEKEFSQIILKDEKIILLFILKYFMKEGAKLDVGEMDLKSLGNESKKVRIIKNEGESRRKMGIIDQSRAFEFTNITSMESYEYLGYIAKNVKNCKKDYVSAVEKEMKMQI
ncbi:hypothetical protein A3K73_06230 [Candidatus Pacearchaeota archaeon RBG_13_36_9]|nr:MAG: hypothetical protein A3K73_06230 [Candidatus Pacearchaeota archaeon RBG_13_36_9]